MRILGVDMGEKRIGLAVSDPLGITAQGLETFNIGKGDPIGAIKEAIREYGAKEVVIGLPLNMDGTEGASARRSAEFAEKLKEEVEIPVKLWDERLSSVEAERIMLEADLSRKKRKGSSDRLSAQIILQSYLDAGGKRAL